MTERASTRVPEPEPEAPGAAGLRLLLTSFDE